MDLFRFLNFMILILFLISPGLVFCQGKIQEPDDFLEKIELQQYLPASEEPEDSEKTKVNYEAFLASINAKGADKIYSNPIIRQRIDELSSREHKRFLSAKSLAVRFTFDELFYIDNLGGVSTISLAEGCKHKCAGCGAGADKLKTFKRMSWNNFESLIKGFTDLEKIFNSIVAVGQKFRFLHSSFLPFRDSDPMETFYRFVDENGKEQIRTVYDAYKLLSTESENIKDIYLTTSGWTNSDAKANAGVYELFKAFFRGELKFKHITFNIKLVTLPVINEYRHFLYNELKNNPEFMKRYGKDFNKHGVDFEKI